MGRKLFPKQGFYTLKACLVPREGMEEIIWCSGERHGNKYIRKSLRVLVHQTWIPIGRLQIPTVSDLARDYDFHGTVCPRKWTRFILASVQYKKEMYRKGRKIKKEEEISNDIREICQAWDQKQRESLIPSVPVHTTVQDLVEVQATLHKKAQQVIPSREVEYRVVKLKEDLHKTVPPALIQCNFKME